MNVGAAAQVQDSAAGEPRLPFVVEPASSVSGSTTTMWQFSLTIPGHGEILRDRVGYAVLVDGRWKVALRTECDLLSLNGLGAQCPPTPTAPAG